MKKYFKLLLITSLFFSVLAGCSANKKGSNAANEKIVVYSNSISNGRGDFLKEEAAKKGFKLELVDLGGNDIYNRLVAEKDAPVADVAFGMNQMNFSSLKNKGILKKYTPNWLGKVDKNLGDKDDYFAPLTEQRVFMIYNADKIKKSEAAKDWKDMYSNPQNKGKYIVPTNLGGATTNAVVYTQLMNNLEKIKNSEFLMLDGKN
jgi:ABC-type Fe3+ transport system, periplasmic component